MTHLKAGQKAPDFKGLDENGNTISLATYKGQKLILYFYPQDNTPTCTTEACNLRDNYDSLKKEGYHILGVSPDSAKKHQNFIKKHNLPFPLLVDQDLALIKAYGCWGPKKMYGKEYDGVYRTTFIIDEKGVIEQVIADVESKRHAEQILEAMATA
ncbi:MAG: thioredoxin-dependent thiol peroxidase [Saprospiraceae bacterium]